MLKATISKYLRHIKHYFYPHNNNNSAARFLALFNSSICLALTTRAAVTAPTIVSDAECKLTGCATITGALSFLRLGRTGRSDSSCSGFRRPTRQGPPFGIM